MFLGGENRLKFAMIYQGDNRPAIFFDITGSDHFGLLGCKSLDGGVVTNG